jgi:hypothetical protein
MNSRGGEVARPPRSGLLRGKSVFMSASVPSPKSEEIYRRIPNAQVEIEDAVVSLARAVFVEGGRLVFGGHPSISPLVAMVAGEYVAVESAERSIERPPAPVVIHQLDVYRPEVPDATQTMERLGQAAIIWHHADPTETHRHWDESAVAYPRSLAQMRREMLADRAIVAMVCIGGMEGVEDEARLFLQTRPGHPIYLLARTGGATAVLASQFGRARHIRVIDDELLDDLRPRLRINQEELVDAPLRFTPYPLIMQRIVRDFTEQR